MASVGDHLRRSDGFGPGFNFLRLALAGGVVLWHCFPLTTGTPALIEQTPFWFLVSAMVPMFFALSGFLVIASAMRIPTGAFLMNRVARILPALVVVILVSALVIGPLLTTLSLIDYFRHPELHRYLLGTVGLVSFQLPGLFESNPLPRVVNGSLWTVPFEIVCYLMVAGLMLARVARHWWALAAIYLAILCGALLVAWVPPGTLPALLDRPLHSLYFAQGSKIIPFFLLGALAYVARDRLPADWRLAALSLAIVLAVGFLVDPASRKGALLWVLTGVPLTYIVVWVGLVRLPTPNFFGGGDFSYGVYLWHFPILQLLVMQFAVSSWWALFLIAIVPVLLVAAASWHGIEKPALKLRKRTSKVGSMIAKQDGPAAAAPPF